MTGRRASALAAVLILGAGAANAAEPNPAAPAGCGVPAALSAIGAALTHAAARVARHEPLTIVAIGSSSTEGIGASAPGRSYPSRLAADLAQRLPKIGIRVINRGKGGEDAPEEVARLARDAVAEHPDLVIWQLGTNAVLRRDDLTKDAALIERGLAELKQSGGDVVLMDLQYAPRVVARPAYARMEQLIAAAARRARVGLFRRFTIMQHWRAAQAEAAPAMIGPDGLHMTDRGYACLAADLADALMASWRDVSGPAVTVAGLPPQRAAATALAAPWP